MFKKCVYQVNEIKDLKSYYKTLNKVKNLIKMFDYIFSSGKVDSCRIFKRISGKYHLLKRDLLECDMFLYKNILEKKKFPDLKKNLMLIKYYKKNIKIIEEYADHTMSGNTSTSIDILAICNILLGVSMIILTYFCINFKDTNLIPIKIDNSIFLFTLLTVIFCLVLFLRSRQLIERFHNFIFNIPNDKILNEIFFDARSRISSNSN